MGDFEDIKIVGVDQDRTRVADSARPGLYDVYFKLSARPPSAWTQIFEQEWQTRYYSRKRHGRVEHDCFVLHCALSEIESDHKPELLDTVRRTNEQYKQYEAKRLRREQQDEERRREADKKKRDTLDGLSFD